MVVLSFTGLAVGVLVSEQQRTQQQLRINQEALNRALRLGTMGEFAAALAHEINQPLTAVANYARVANDHADAGLASEATDKSSSRSSARPRSSVGCATSSVSDAAKPLRSGDASGRRRRLPIAAPSSTAMGIQLQLRIARDLPAVGCRRTPNRAGHHQSGTQFG